MKDLQRQQLFDQLKVTYTKTYPGLLPLGFTEGSPHAALYATEPAVLEPDFWTPVPLGFRATFPEIMVAWIARHPAVTHLSIRDALRRHDNKCEWSVDVKPEGPLPKELKAGDLIAAVVFTPVFRPRFVEGEV
jgi:hypothetical protein